MLQFKNEDLKTLLDRGILFGSKAFKTNVKTSDKYTKNWKIDENSSKFKKFNLKNFEKLKKEINSILLKDINLIDNN